MQGGPLKFAIKTEEPYLDKQGQEQISRTFVDCVAWGKTSESIEQHVQDGDLICCEGRIEKRSYEGKNGKVWTTQVNVQRWSFVQSQPQTQGEAREQLRFDQPKSEQASVPDDLPF